MERRERDEETEESVGASEEGGLQPKLGAPSVKAPTMKHSLWLATAPPPPSAAAVAAAAASRRRRGRFRQHLAALAANLTSLCVGIATGWSSPALRVLLPPANATNSSGHASSPALSEDAASWLGALMALGAATGALPAGLLGDALGRRRAVLALAVPFALGWIALADASTLWLLYLGRLLTGLGSGATTVLVPLYCEEIAEVEIRGALGTYLDFMVCLGILWIYILGAYVSYFWFTASGVLWSAVFLITFFWMPESPVFLVSKDLPENARQSLEWLRGRQSNDIQLELDNIISSCKSTSSINCQEYCSTFFTTNPMRSTTIRAFAIVLGIMLFQQLSGINAVFFYALQIFNKVGSTLSGDTSSIILGIVQIFTVLCSTITVDHLGRQFLLLLSSIVLALCLLCLSLYAHFYKDNKENDPSIILWIPLICLILYVAFYSLGFGPLPWLIMAELLPTNAKGWASAVAVSFNWLTALVLTKEFPIMLEHVGQDITYGVLCSFCLLGTVFIIKCFPETKGKTKLEIEESIGGDKP